VGYRGIHEGVKETSRWSAGVAGAQGQGIRWHVLQTLPRQEKVLSRDLGARNIEHFLPLREQVRSYGRRKLSSHLPLFPGYLFLHGTIEEAYIADRTQRVVRLIQVADQRQLHAELENIRLALNGGLTLDPYPYLRAGIRVVVTRGPLKGLEGLIEDKPSPDRLILQIDLLGRAVSMEIDAAVLEPVGFDR
jgi:transcriptional antiterminator NusG